MIATGFQMELAPEKLMARGGEKAAGSGDGRGDSFLDILKNAVRDDGTASSEKNTGKSETAPMSGILNLLNRGRENADFGVIDMLKKHLTSKYTDTDKIAISGDALDSLKKYLVGAGMDEVEVAEVIDALKESGSDEGITLDDLFGALENIEEPQEALVEGPMIGIGMVPHIESVLTGMGLPPETVAAVMDMAKVEGRGIDMSKLISGLKEIEGAAFMKGVSLSAPADDQLSGILKAMGIEATSTDGRPFGIEDFVKALEGIRKGAINTAKGSNAVDGEAALDMENEDLRGFLGSVQEVRAAEASLASAASGMGLVDKKTDRVSDTPEFTRGEKFAKGKKTAKAGVNSAKQGEAVDALKTAGPDGEAGAGIDPEIEAKFSGSFTPSEPEMKRETDAGDRFRPAPGATDPLERVNAPKTSDPVIATSGPAGEAEILEKAVDGAAVKPAGKNLPVYVVNQVGRELARSFNTGDNELRFHLKPPQMGRLQMSIDNSSDGLKVTIIAEHQTTKDMLMSYSNELRANLAEQGIKLESIDVSFSSNYDQAMADQKENRSGNRGEKNSGGQAGTVKDGLAAKTTGTDSRAASGLDLVA